MIDEAKDFGKELLKDTKEVILERVFSPMYFYFILAWIIYNWTFLYSLLFVDSEKLKQNKVDYLLSFYPTNTFWDYLCNTWYVILGPAVSTYILIWWISIFSEKTYRKFETYKLNKKTISRLLIYEEKVKIAKEQREIRNQESDQPDIRYTDNEEFNEWFDEINDYVVINGISYKASEALYSTDFESYKNAFEDYKNRDVEEEE